MASSPSPLPQKADEGGKIPSPTSTVRPVSDLDALYLPF